MLAKFQRFSFVLVLLGWVFPIQAEVLIQATPDNGLQPRLSLDSNGDVVDTVTYSDGFQGDDDTWPQGADAEGSTLELINPDFDNLSLIHISEPTRPRLSS
mgnify:CR=1 FL=1